MKEPTKFENIETIGRFVVRWLYVYGAVALLSAFMHFAKEDFYYGTQRVLHLQSSLWWMCIYSLLYFASSLLYWVCAVPFLIWFGRTYRNGLRFTARVGMPISAVKPVLSWMIPIWNWFGPYLYMRKIWIASDPRAVDGQPGSQWVPFEMKVWWTLFVGAPILNVAAALAVLVIMSGPTKLLSILGECSQLTILAITAFLCARLVNEITNRQLHKIHMHRDAEYSNREPATSTPMLSVPNVTVDDGGATIEIKHEEKVAAD